MRPAGPIRNNAVPETETRAKVIGFQRASWPLAITSRVHVNFGIDWLSPESVARN